MAIWLWASRILVSSDMVRLSSLNISMKRTSRRCAESVGVTSMSMLKSMIVVAGESNFAATAAISCVMRLTAGMSALLLMLFI